MTNDIVVRTRKPLRTWPLMVIAGLFAAILILVPVFSPGEPLSLLLMIGGVVSALLITLWWLLFSRARWTERVGAIGLIALGVVLTRMAVDASIAGGAQGMLGYIFGFVFFAFALAVWAAATSAFDDRTRRMALVPVMLLLGCAPMLAIRTEGVYGGGFVLHWRWTPTPEELLLAHVNDEPKPLPPAPVVEAPKETAPAPTVEIPAAVAPTPVQAAPQQPAAPAVIAKAAEWPGFRGANRDSVVRDVRINTDWSAAPPVQMWRRPIGPGWSSFSVRGDVLYTQEQRGQDEIVAAYKVSTGEPVWRHRDPIRFYESNGGAGPRATPTIHNDRVYAHGATGMLNALDANTGKVIWAHNTSVDAKRDVPMWGISSSPLVVDEVVIVSVYGTLTAYDLATGKLRWVGPMHGGAYSSPHLVTLDGVPQVVILSAPGAVSVNPGDGKLLWEHRWEGGAIVQPAITSEGDILINAMAATGGLGTRRLVIKHSGTEWAPEERWTSNGLKPYFNDLVIHKGHAFGFDGSILSCIDLADGKRKWKGGRYGNGQMLLLADQDVLLVLSEDGELALVSATPDQYKEIARVPALNAKTWNHPVIVGNVLLIRNGEEMAAFRLSPADAATTIH